MQEAPKTFDVVMHLDELIMQRRVGYRCEMENSVKFLPAELLRPIHRRKILGNKIPAITTEIFEITGAKIVDHSQPRGRKFILQRQGKVGADETGATGDKQIGSS